MASRRRSSFDTKPHEVVEYAIPGHETGGRLYVFGNKGANKILMFLPGYPDTAESFIPFVQALLASNPMGAFLCGVTCLPGYDRHTTEQQQEFKAGGYTIDETVTAFREATKILRERVATNKGAEMIGIFHDWGCLTGAIGANRLSLDHNRQYFSKLVFMDLLPPTHPDLKIVSQDPWHDQVIRAVYQHLFGLVYVTNYYLGSIVSILLYRLVLLLLHVLRLYPVNKMDDATVNEDVISTTPLSQFPYMVYIYYYVWKTYHTEGTIDGYHLPKDNVLFLYGDAKDRPVQFWSQAHLEWLQQQDSCRVVAVPNAGHWVHKQQPEACLKALSDFCA